MPAAEIFSIRLIDIVKLAVACCPTVIFSSTLTNFTIREHLGCCNRRGWYPERSKIGNMPHGRRYSEKSAQALKALGGIICPAEWRPRHSVAEFLNKGVGCDSSLLSVR